jgi:hypothetical protein
MPCACAIDMPMLSFGPMRARGEELEPASRSAVGAQRPRGRTCWHSGCCYCTQSATGLAVWSTLGPVAGSVTPVQQRGRHLCEACGPQLRCVPWTVGPASLAVAASLQLTYLTRSSGTLLCLHALLLARRTERALRRQRVVTRRPSPPPPPLCSRRMCCPWSSCSCSSGDKRQRRPPLRGDVPSRVSHTLRLLLRFMCRASVGERRSITVAAKSRSSGKRRYAACCFSFSRCEGRLFARPQWPHCSPHMSRYSAWPESSHGGAHAGATASMSGAQTPHKRGHRHEVTPLSTALQQATATTY